MQQTPVCYAAWADFNHVCKDTEISKSTDNLKTVLTKDSDPLSYLSSIYKLKKGAKLTLLCFFLSLFPIHVNSPNKH